MQGRVNGSSLCSGLHVGCCLQGRPSGAKCHALVDGQCRAAQRPAAAKCASRARQRRCQPAGAWCAARGRVCSAGRSRLVQDPTCPTLNQLASPCRRHSGAGQPGPLGCPGVLQSVCCRGANPGSQGGRKEGREKKGGGRTDRKKVLRRLPMPRHRPSPPQTTKQALAFPAAAPNILRLAFSVAETRVRWRAPGWVLDCCKA